MLREAIESGELEPGARLAVGDLVDFLDMSPTPIREALRLLQRDGLADYRAHFGMYVASFTADRREDVQRMRLALEPLAAALAAERATPEDIERLDALHAEFSRSVREDPRGPDAPRLNREWHAALYAASHSELLVEFIERLWVIIGANRFFSIHGNRSVEEHGAVLDALKAKDAQQVEERLRGHLRSVEEELTARAPRSAPVSE
jgi:DNA-binding GntR family transcriptional regulator